VVKCLITEEIQGQFSALWVYYINNLISRCKYYVTNILTDFFLKMIFRPCYLLFGKTSIENNFRVLIIYTCYFTHK
jgi:hypothetical protein